MRSETPQEPKALPESKPNKETEYTFEEPISYRYPCGAKGSLRYCPKHKQKGEEVKKVLE